ncbi:MAG: twin-arginine translocase TatA/TatE family subunit [Myxococcus sp.]|nr:twin-arginine translocase TatA/TatE family subunit [Myxococcus sp.]
MNIGTGELIFIAIAALLILGPTKLPEFARTIGKLVRDFKRQTDDVRSTVEREFYKMDQELQEPPAPLPQPAPDAIAHGDHHEGDVPTDDAAHHEGSNEHAFDGSAPEALPAGEPELSQVMKGAPAGEPVVAASSPASEPVSEALPADAPAPEKATG